MKTFLTGLACGILLTTTAIVYLEFTKESSGGFTDYVQPLLSQLNEVIPTDSSPDSAPDQHSEEAKMLRVIDGDTIDVEINGERQRVRYIGMNTPERNEPCFDEATAANVELVHGKVVRLVKVDFPAFARHQIALKSNSMRSVYEQQTIHRRIQERSRKTSH